MNLNTLFGDKSAVYDYELYINKYLLLLKFQNPLINFL